MKILVTGAGGYIGSVTCSQLLEAGYDLVCLDNFSRGYRAPLEFLQNRYGAARVVIQKADLTCADLTAYFALHSIAAVIHFAALLDVGESMHKPVEYFSNNVIGTQRLIEAMHHANVRQLVFSSSCTVYGNAQYLPIDEKHPVVQPESVYGASKKICEDMLSWYSRQGILEYIALRYFNICGASDDGALGDSKRPSFHLMQNAVLGALGLREFTFNYAAVDTPDGSPVRDYVNVVDLANAHVAALRFLECEKRTEIFNLGTGTGNSVLEIVNTVKRVTGKDFPVSSDPNRRTGEADKMVANYSKAHTLLGWKPERSLEQSVQSLVTWYSTHPKGWEY
ncbi:MAG: UDP-glucose 4-epimerase GalE [Deinococcales bacterium]